jgi:hypothetical protein
MARRRAKHVGPRRPGRHVAERRATLRLSDDDGSFSAALIVACCLGLGIASVIGSGLLT